MDNIQKMVFGVISVAGLIALAVPETDPIAPVSSEALATAAPPSDAALPPPPPAPLPMQYDEESVSDFQSAQPSIDGNPVQPDFGMPFGTSAQSSSNNPDSGQSNQASGYTPPPFVMPGSAPVGQSGADASTMTGVVK